jgi:hypothetical protein
MKKVLIVLLILLLMLLPGCLTQNRSDFSKRKYINHRGMHRQIPIFRQDQYRNPVIKPPRKKELVKVVKTYAEDAKIAIRNIRRDVMETLKKLQKSSSISEDVLNTKTKEFEEITKTFVEKVDSVILLKEKEILPNK